MAGRAAAKLALACSWAVRHPQALWPCLLPRPTADYKCIIWVLRRAGSGRLRNCSANKPASCCVQPCSTIPCHAAQRAPLRSMCIIVALCCVHCVCSPSKGWRTGCRVRAVRCAVTLVCFVCLICLVCGSSSDCLVGSSSMTLWWQLAAPSLICCCCPEDGVPASPHVRPARKVYLTDGCGLGWAG